MISTIAPRIKLFSDETGVQRTSLFSVKIDIEREEKSGSLPELLLGKAHKDVNN